MSPWLFLKVCSENRDDSRRKWEGDLLLRCAANGWLFLDKAYSGLVSTGQAVPSTHGKAPSSTDTKQQGGTDSTSALIFGRPRRAAAQEVTHGTGLGY